MLFGSSGITLLVFFVVRAESWHTWYLQQLGDRRERCNKGDEAECVALQPNVCDDDDDEFSFPYVELVDTDTEGSIPMKSICKHEKGHDTIDI